MNITKLFKEVHNYPTQLSNQNFIINKYCPVTHSAVKLIRRAREKCIEQCVCYNQGRPANEETFTAVKVNRIVVR